MESGLDLGREASVEDNMSLSEIVQKRFRKNMKINKLNTPEQIEKFIISKPALVNNELNFDGTLQQQLQLESQIEGLETNQMASWSDLDSIMETI